MSNALWLSTGWRFGTVLLLCAACSSPPAGLATVGQEAISQTDITYRIGIARAYGNQGMTDATALVSLVNDALEREVGRKAGIIATAKELAGFSKHVEQSSKAPRILARVKKVFGDDVAAFKRIYLLPKIINRKLRQWFSRDAGMQAKERAAIEQAYALVQSGKSLEDAARATLLTYAEQTYETDTKAAPDALKPYFPKGMAAMSEGFRKVLDQLNAGETAHTIIEDDAVYRVVRLLEKTDGSYRTGEIISRKRLFDGWYRQQAERIPIAIRDERLKASLCDRYRQLYWLGKVCVR